jgi:hypothetical protein
MKIVLFCFIKYIIQNCRIHLFNLKFWHYRVILDIFRIVNCLLVLERSLSFREQTHNDTLPSPTSTGLPRLLTLSLYDWTNGSSLFTKEEFMSPVFANVYLQLNLEFSHQNYSIAYNSCNCSLRMSINIKLHYETMDLVSANTKLETMNLTKLLKPKTICQPQKASQQAST